MYSTKSYKLTAKEYNYLLPVLRSKLLYTNDRYYFIGTFDELPDMLDRLKGLYNTFDELNNMTAYKCAKIYDLEPFRNELCIVI
jgi:hypothetical protein